MTDVTIYRIETLTTDVEMGDGGQFTVTYRPGALTPRALANLSGGEWYVATAAWLADALVDWDLEEGGEPLKYSRAALMGLPWEIVHAIGLRLLPLSMDPNEARRTNRNPLAALVALAGAAKGWLVRGNKKEEE